MDVERIATVAIAAPAVIGVYLACYRALKGHVVSAIVTLPLALAIPWGKRFPATGDALALAASVAVLWVWLYAHARPERARRALIMASVVVFVKPELVALVLAAIAVESWRRRDTIRPAKSAAALALMTAVAAASAVVLHPVPPAAAVAGLWGRIASGGAWDSTNWVFAGADIRTSLKSASTYGATFYLPLLVPLAAMSYRYRRERWFTPLFGWCATMLVLTVWLAGWPALRASLPLAAGLLVAFGTTGS